MEKYEVSQVSVGITHSLTYTYWQKHERSIPLRLYSNLLVWCNVQVMELSDVGRSAIQWEHVQANVGWLDRSTKSDAEVATNGFRKIKPMSTMMVLALVLFACFKKFPPPSCTSTLLFEVLILWSLRKNRRLSSTSYGTTKQGVWVYKDAMHWQSHSVLCATTKLKNRVLDHTQFDAYPFRLCFVKTKNTSDGWGQHMTIHIHTVFPRHWGANQSFRG